jgi:hypothetical protein
MDCRIVIEDLLIHDVQKSWKFLRIIVKLMSSTSQYQSYRLITYLVKWYDGESGLNDMFLFIN